MNDVIPSDKTMAVSKLDWRQHAYRADLADARLRSQVRAEAFVDGWPAEVGNTALPLLRRPSLDAPMDSQVLPGEAVRVFEKSDDWAWVQCGHDGYVGYVASNGLTKPAAEPATHVVCARETVVLSDAEQVCAPLYNLSMGTAVRVTETGKRFHTLASGGYVFAEHLRAVDAIEADWVDVAQRLMGLPYLWGGRGASGIDCSGLVQVALAACGIGCPRDSDQQAAGLGQAVALDPALWRRGDAIYVRGHVVLDAGDGSVIHATGYRWSVIVEERQQCLDRLARMDRPVIAVRRPEVASDA